MQRFAKIRGRESKKRVGEHLLVINVIALS